MPASKKVSKYPTDILLMYTRFAEMDQAFDPRANDALVLQFPTTREAANFRHRLNSFGYAMEADIQFQARSDAALLIRAHDRREIVLKSEPTPHLIIRLRSQNPSNILAMKAMEEYFSQRTTPSAPLGAQAGIAPPAEANARESANASPSTPPPTSSMSLRELQDTFPVATLMGLRAPASDLEREAVERYRALCAAGVRD